MAMAVSVLAVLDGDDGTLALALAYVVGIVVSA